MKKPCNCTRPHPVPQKGPSEYVPSLSYPLGGLYGEPPCCGPGISQPPKPPEPEPEPRPCPPRVYRNPPDVELVEGRNIELELGKTDTKWIYTVSSKADRTRVNAGEHVEVAEEVTDDGTNYTISSVQFPVVIDNSSVSTLYGNGTPEHPLGIDLNVYATKNDLRLKQDIILPGTDLKMVNNIISVDTDGLVTGEMAFVEGCGTTANGIAAHAEGHNTNARGYVSHTEGKNTYAGGQCDHVEGMGGISECGTMHHIEGFQYHSYASNGPAEDFYNTNVVKFPNSSTVTFRNNDTYGTMGSLYELVKILKDKFIVSCEYSASNIFHFTQSTFYDPKLYSILDVSLDQTDDTIVLTLDGTIDCSVGGDLYLYGPTTISTLTGAGGPLTPGVPLNKITFYGSLGFQGNNTTNVRPDNSFIGITLSYTKVGETATTNDSRTVKVLDIEYDGSRYIVTTEDITFPAIQGGSYECMIFVTNSIQYGCNHIEGQDNSIKAAANAHAEGFSNTITYGSNSHVEGRNNIVSLSNSHAEGYSTIADGDASHSEGSGTHANDDYAHAEGYYTTANKAAHAEGWRTNALGDYAHSEGYQTNAQGGQTHAEGRETNATADQSHSEGAWTTASGQGSHAEGFYSNATAIYAHAEGYNTTANSTAAHTEGYGTRVTVNGYQGHAEGRDTVVSGTAGHAEGKETQSTGFTTHAEGYNTRANGDSAHAEGEGTYAAGDYSHAEGKDTEATGKASHASGRGTRTSAPDSFVCGKYNSPTGSEIFEIGDGTSNLRHTCFRVDNAGRLWFMHNNTLTNLSEFLNNIADAQAPLHMVTKTASATITMDNNSLNVIEGTPPATMTLSCSAPAGQAVSFVAQVTAGSSDSTLVIEVNGQSTLYNSTAGNTLEAGKIYQISCLNNCWTMAAFEVPI